MRGGASNQYGQAPLLEVLAGQRAILVRNDSLYQDLPSMSLRFGTLWHPKLRRIT